MPAATSSCSSGWMGDDSTLCTQQPPKRFAHPRPDVRRRHLARRGRNSIFAYVVVGLALAAGPERWTAMEGGFAVRATFRFRHLARPALIAALIVVIVERSAIKDRNQMRR